MEINKIYNESCFDTMDKMSTGMVDIILTSPPYCTPNDDARKYTDAKFRGYQVHYDVFEGFESAEEYRQWTVDLFTCYSKILKKDGVVLYNISYTAANPDLLYLCMSDVISKTDFMIVDCISWKKKSALPQNMNPNRLTRVCEFIFVLCRKGEENNFWMNKEKAGAKYKNLYPNFIETQNNDIQSTEVNRLNSATFSSALVMALLRMYARKDFIVYDSFMGTGTTAVGCKRFGCNFIGSEISQAQVEFANTRLNGITKLYIPQVKQLF